MKALYLFLSAALVSSGLFAQTSEHVSWKFTARNLGQNSFEVVMTPTVDAPWHIYSLNSPDGVGQPTRFSFTSNPLISLEGKTTETGKLVSLKDPSTGLTARYFSGPVHFVQKVKVRGKAKTRLTGTVEYMVCNDHQCLPPVKLPFSVSL